MHEGLGLKKNLKISAQLNSWRVVDFSSSIFLAQSSLGESLIYCVGIFSNRGYSC